MDTRTVFFLVFCFTLLSTLLVAFTCIMTGQSVIETCLYTIVSMWISGVSSQLLIQHLYNSVIRPLEEERAEMSQAEKREKVAVNLHEVEKIDELLESAAARATEEVSPMPENKERVEEEIRV